MKLRISEINEAEYTNVVLLTTIVLSLFCSTSFAQKKLSTREILDKTAQVMKQDGGIKAKFVTTLFQGTTPKDEVSGDIKLLGEKYVMSTESMSTWFDGSKQWNLIYENREVTVTTPTPEELQASSPTLFIDLYQEGFKLSHKNASLRGREVWEVTLKPENRKQEPSVIVISIDKQNYYPLCLRIRNNGDWTRISISDFTPSAGLNKNDFSYPAQEYPQYEVIEY